MNEWTSYKIFIYPRQYMKNKKKKPCKTYQIGAVKNLNHKIWENKKDKINKQKNLYSEPSEKESFFVQMLGQNQKLEIVIDFYL